MKNHSIKSALIEGKFQWSSLLDIIQIINRKISRDNNNTVNPCQNFMRKSILRFFKNINQF